MAIARALVRFQEEPLYCLVRPATPCVTINMVAWGVPQGLWVACFFSAVSTDFHHVSLSSFWCSPWTEAFSFHARVVVCFRLPRRREGEEKEKWSPSTGQLWPHIVGCRTVSFSRWTLSPGRHQYSWCEPWAAAMARGVLRCESEQDRYFSSAEVSKLCTV